MRSLGLLARVDPPSHSPDERSRMMSAVITELVLTSRLLRSADDVPA